MGKTDYKIYDLINKTHLFNELSDKYIAELTDIADIKSYKEGESIYELGDNAEHCYIVADGRVRFSLGYGDNVSNTGAIVSKGDFFGWAAIIEKQSRRIAKATCLDNVNVIALEGQELKKIFDSNHDVGYLVYKRLANLIMHDFITYAAG